MIVRKIIPGKRKTTMSRSGKGIHKTGQASQGGFSLVEVLVSMLVLAVGLLGISALLIVSLQNAQGASSQNQATIQASTMLDAMRANKPAAIVGQYNLSQYTCNTPAEDSRIGTEQANWIRNLHEQVSPTACGRIRCTSLNCEVSVRWDDTRSTGGSEEREYVLSTRL